MTTRNDLQFWTCDSDSSFIMMTLTHFDTLIEPLDNNSLISILDDVISFVKGTVLVVIIQYMMTTINHLQFWTHDSDSSFIVLIH